MKKIISILLVAITLVGVIAFPSYAAKNTSIVPCFNNGDNCKYSFNISSSGLSEVSITYAGMSGVMKKVTVTTYIQKKTLGLFWTKVDIGTTDKQWVDEATNVSGRFVHQFQLKSTGTYRAVFKIVFSGTGGSDDVIEDKIEKKYS